MSVTTDELDAVRETLSEANERTTVTPEQIGHLIIAVGQLTRIVEKMNARVLFLEQEQQRQENY